MRIAYLTDSHYGSTGNGYHRQPCWAAGWPVLMERLGKWVRQQQVDLVIHGGDLIEDGSVEQMTVALDHLAGLERPCLVCLGNHDICRPGALEQWLKLLEHYPTITLADAGYAADSCDVYLLNNHWQADRGPEMYWDPVPPFRHSPCLRDEQYAWLDAQLGGSDKPALVVVHTQVEPVPPTEPDLESYIPVEYPARLNAVLDRHPRCRLVLTGHCHVTTARPRGGRMHLTTAAFIEVPFHVRLIDIDEQRIEVRTHALEVDAQPVAFDADSAWVVGEQADRDFIIPLCDGCGR